MFYGHIHYHSLYHSFTNYSPLKAFDIKLTKSHFVVLIRPSQTAAFPTFVILQSLADTTFFKRAVQRDT